MGLGAEQQFESAVTMAGKRVEHHILKFAPDEINNSGEQINSLSRDLSEPRILKSPPAAHSATNFNLEGEGGVSMKLKQMREDYERIKDEVH